MLHKASGLPIPEKKEYKFSETKPQFWKGRHCADCIYCLNENNKYICLLNTPTITTRNAVACEAHKRSQF